MKTTRHETMALGLLTAIFFVSSIGYTAETAAENHTVWLSGLDLSKMTAGWGKPQVDLSVQSKPITIAGKKFDKGVGTHADSILYVDLRGTTERFSASVGVDDEVAGQPASIRFRIFGDDKELWSSGIMKAGEAAKSVDVSVKGIKVLILSADPADDGVNYDHADWADARFLTAGDNPQAIAPPAEEEILLTPAPPRPRRSTARRSTACGPARPSCTASPAPERGRSNFPPRTSPRAFPSTPRPASSPARSPRPAPTKVTLIAKNAQGEDRREFRIVVGDTLALTPPMGWNSWYIHYNRVTDAIMRAGRRRDDRLAAWPTTATSTSTSTTAGWSRSTRPTRKSAAPPATTRAASCPTSASRHEGHDRLHPRQGAQGRHLHLARPADLRRLRGQLSSTRPWTPEPSPSGASTSSSTTGAPTARWPAATTCEHLMKPYQLMWDELQKLDRDIVLNLCQYGMGDVWKWGGAGRPLLAHHRRPGPGKSGQPCPGFYSIGLSNAKHWRIRQTRRAGTTPTTSSSAGSATLSGMGEGQPTTLTPNEQYSYMSMWCLMAAPLIFSGDMAKLDAVHAQHPLQPRGDRGRPGPARQAGPHRPADRPRVRPRQGPGRRLEGRGPVQSGYRLAAAGGHVAGSRRLRQAAGPRPVAAKRPRRPRRRIQNLRPPPWRNDGPSISESMTRFSWAIKNQAVNRLPCRRPKLKIGN